jgi:predicted P-loop ATPase
MAEDFDFDAAYSSWSIDLDRTGSGAALKSFRNACIALRAHPDVKGRIAYDEFAGCTYVRGPLPWDDRAHRAWNQHDDLAATEWLQGLPAPDAIGVSSAVAREAVERVAYDNRFHPVLEWLEGLEWDGTDRLDGWLTTYLGVQPTPLSAAIGRAFLISAVARIQKPGCKVDHMPVLEGPQGILKSTALRTLVGADDWFTDQVADLGTKDSCQDLRGKWLIEISELDAMRRSAEVERVKAYVSRQIDHYRPSYGRRSGDVPRQCVFAGSTNAEEYLSDATGGRRFWPVACGQIDLEGIGRDREQLWAEAVAAYHAGERWWLEDHELKRMAAEEQEARRIRHPWEPVIADWLDNPTKAADRDGTRLPLELDGQVTTAQLLEHAIAKPVERQTTADLMAVGKILKLLGWKKHKAHGRIVWKPGDTSDPAGDASFPEGVPAEARANGHAEDTGDTCDARDVEIEGGYMNITDARKGVQGVPGYPHDWPEPDEDGRVRGEL